MTDAIYSDPRLVALYDALNPAGEDTAFYLRLAGSEPRRILDLGCGTGLLACALADQGHAVTGIDPAAGMLAIARQRSGSDKVRWLQADARTFEVAERFDLAIMTGHVFQAFLDDADVRSVLHALRRHVPSGGRIAFETRNPLACGWESWTPAASQTRVCVDGVGEVDVHHRVIEVAGGRVSFETHHRFLASAETSVTRSTLRFMMREELADQLAHAGFAQLEWFGDWMGAPWTSSSREIIVVAS